MKRIIVALMLAAMPMLIFAGCGGGESTTPASGTQAAADYDPPIDPANFTGRIDNRYFPLTPGTTYVFEGETDEGKEVNEVAVTNQTKKILGVTCVVVRDTVKVNGEVVEQTDDWFAQDREGNVWYFGEDSKDYEDGVVKSTSGSWEAGKDGARPGIVMKANPQVGDSYRQEYSPGVAEDMGEVLRLDEAVTVGAGSYQSCVVTRDYSPLEPGVEENKYYCPLVGVVKTVMVEGGDEVTELVEVVTI